MDIGIINLDNIAIKPLPISPTTPNKYKVDAKVAANRECNKNNGGAINKNVNSNGSVIPANIAVIAVGTIKDNVSFFFSGKAVA